MVGFKSMASSSSGLHAYIPTGSNSWCSFFTRDLVFLRKNLLRASRVGNLNLTPPPLKGGSGLQPIRWLTIWGIEIFLELFNIDKKINSAHKDKPVLLQIWVLIGLHNCRVVYFSMAIYILRNKYCFLRYATSCGHGIP